MQTPSPRTQQNLSQLVTPQDSLVPVTTSLNPQNHTVVAFTSLKGESSDGMHKLHFYSKATGIEDKLEKVVVHSSDPTSGRELNMRVSDDDSNDSDYTGNSQENEEELESAGSLEF